MNKMFQLIFLRFHWQNLPLCLGFVVFALFSPGTVRANVYATNIRLNGNPTNAFLATGSNSIAYILNEAATAGLVINIESGATTVRTITLTNPGPGTARGTNLVFWDGKDTNGVSVGPGNYGIRITASATGYGDWTKISDDANLGNYSWEPRGVAVNKNSTSLYYGRIFVGNSHEGTPNSNVPGDLVGIQKLNADCSAADEGTFSDGGWPWAGDYFSPWRIEVANDDKVYICDFTVGGVVLSFDQILSAASRRIVLNTNNFPSSAVGLSGPFITGTGTNMQLWMADTASPDGVGIRRWQLGTNGVAATNDVGVTIVQAGAGSDLSVAPFDVALDSSNRIYTVQNSLFGASSGDRVFRFPPYSGTPELTADWKIGNGDDTTRGASGIAVDPAARYVAVAFIGSGFGAAIDGATRVYDTTNGNLIVTLPPIVSHAHTDVAWDNVGNLYALDESDGILRIYSPPGTNQAATLASFTLQASSPILLTAPFYTTGQFHFTLNGQPNASYIIQGSTNLQAWTPVATNVSPNAARSITLNAPATYSFYRAVVGP